MTMITTPLREYRCSCGKLLFKGALGMGSIEIKCRRCSQIRRFVAKSAVN